MKRIFYYAHTGHRIGLDRFHRAAAIINALSEYEITLLTSDYRIAQIAHTYGIKRSVGVDVVRNIPQIAHNGDILIFDSAEANPAMLADMQRFFSVFIRIGDDPEDQVFPGEYLVNPYVKDAHCCNALAIDKKFFEPAPKSEERVFFFGDDDYEEDLFKHKATLAGSAFKLLLGFYFFVNYEEKLKDAFAELIEPEEYEETIRQAKLFVTCSPIAALQALASGSRPIYLQREDYPKDFLPLFGELHIPCADFADEEALVSLIKTNASHDYCTPDSSAADVAGFIKKILN
jgi:hypothetical protein